jgi:hypothetical protein
MIALQGGTAKAPTPTGPLRHLIAEACENVVSMPTIGEQLTVIVSIGNRVPMQLGLRSLSAWQRAAHQVLAERVALKPVAGAAAESLPPGHVVVGMFVSGRLAFAPVEGFDGAAIPFVAGALDASDRKRIEVICVELLALEVPRLSEVDAYFESIGDSEARAMVQSVAAKLDRVDPISVFIGDETFTNVPEHNDLLQGRADREGSFLLTELQQTPSSQWSSAVKAFVACMFWLQEGGFRGEEFNGCQLTPAALDAFFDEKLREYAELVGDAATPPRSASLADKARAVARIRQRLTPGWTFYRWVNGVTLYKEQRLYRSSEVPTMRAEGLGASAQQYLLKYSVPVEGRAVDESFVEFVRSVLTDSTPDAQLGMHPIECLLALLVSNATELLQSDFGMSRCIRRLADLARVHELDLVEEANAWPQSEYFCAVLPGTRARDKEGVRDSVEIMRAISARMRFNGWHYMPGHFPAARKPPERHVYNPPAMCDTAEWSDQRHRGHVAAEVRYSIRAPAPLYNAGKTYPGFCDLRVMRRDGDPYTLPELQVATQHARTIAALFQAVLDVSVRERYPFRVEAFTNQWFKEARWDLLLPGS